MTDGTAGMRTRTSEHRPTHRRVSVDDCRLLEFPKITDERGNLSVIEGGRQVPFEIKRIFYLYDVPGGSTRGGHAHRALHQVLIAMSGSFTVTVDDGYRRKKFPLNRSYYGLYMPPLIWREIDDFSSGSVCLAIVSEMYSESDYYRDYQEFLAAVRGKR